MTIRLPRLAANAQISDATGRPTQSFVVWWQTAMQQIEAALANATDASGAAAAAEAAAVVANAAAELAQSAADEATEVSALANSYPTGLTITATDTGVDVTITISGHTRIYADGTSVTVSAGLLLAQPYGETIHIYYDQPGRTGGAVTYQGSTTASDVAQINGRHSVGAVPTPLAGEADRDGNPAMPPGAALG